jgi:hypothetical protein
MLVLVLGPAAWVLGAVRLPHECPMSQMARAASRRAILSLGVLRA